MQSWLEKQTARPQRAVLLFGLALLLAGNWLLPLTDRDEARFAEASREMLQRGDYVVPWFNGAWRFDKPVLIYWCQMASYQVCGENAFGARLPSVLFTVATALVLVHWGRKRMNAKTGAFAGLMFLGGLHVAVIGRVATADMAMVFFTLLAVWSGWELTCPEQAQRRRWWWVFYVALAGGFLAKGPVAWLPLGGILLGRILRKDSFRLPLLETVVGLLLTLALVACWGIPALLQTQGQFWHVGMGEHVLNRSVGVIDGHGLKGLQGFLITSPLYFLMFIVSFLPWTLHQPEGFEPLFEKQKSKGGLGQLLVVLLRGMLFFLYIPVKIWRWWPERKKDDLGWYLLLQALLVFAVFSLVKTKLPHYTMPAFPCLALWLARQISSEEKSFAWMQKRLVTIAVFILVLTLAGFPLLTRHLLTERLWNQLQPQVRPETKIACLGYVEPSLVWKFRSVSTNMVVLGEVNQARDFLTNPPPYILVVPTKNLAEVPNTNGLQVEVHGLDMVKFKNWELTAIVR